jgi:restriction system protein
MNVSDDLSVVVDKAHINLILNSQNSNNPLYISVFVTLLMCFIVYFLGAASIWWYVLIVVVGASEGLKLRFKQTEERSIYLNMQASIKKQMNALVRQRQMLVRIDAYGNEITDKWHKEVARFVDSVLLPGMSKSERARVQADQVTFNRALNVLLIWPVADEAKRRTVGKCFDPTMNAREFEAHCARVLQSHGWQATTTAATGDQGADVIAEKQEHRVVLQAKLYNSPVGNKAVQEAHSAKFHYKASAAVVVTNSSFTASAQQLAQSTGVHLLHHSELPELEVMITDTDDAAQELSHKLVLAGFMPGMSP